MAYGSPALTQLDGNYLPWPDTTRLRGFPGRGQRFVQRAALVVREVVTLGVCYEVDNCLLGQSGWLIENEPTLLDVCSERAHVATVRLPRMTGKCV